MQLHHIGCLTLDMNRTVAGYRALNCSEVSEEYYVESQEVKIRFLRFNDIYLELIQPLNTKSKLYRLKEKGASFYHIAFITDSYDRDKEELLKRHVFVTEFSSEAFENKRCMFVFNSEKHLIELVEE